MNLKKYFRELNYEIQFKIPAHKNPSFLSKLVFIFLTILGPLFFAIYWLYTVKVSWISVFFAIVFFLLPTLYLFRFVPLRTPFFTLPFTTGFVLALFHPTWQTFIIHFICLTGVIEIGLAFFRTRPPWNKIYFILDSTLYFRDFFEIRTFWRICVVSTVPIMTFFFWSLIPLFAGTWF